MLARLAVRFAAVIFAGLVIFAVRPTRAAVSLADPLPLPRIESRMLLDASAGRFQNFSLIQAALVASGVNSPGELTRLNQKYLDWLADARQFAGREPTELAQAKALFKFLHSRILTAHYDSRATEINRPLDEGLFNCVSATVLFTALACDCGLDVRAIERPHHARCVLYLRDPIAISPQVDIETTCATWFEIPPEKRRQAELAAIARSAVGDRFTAGKEIGPAALVAVIYYNRGVDLLHDKRFAEAISVDLSALRLDPTNDTARGNLLASINNWALDECAASQFAAATDLLTQGRRMAPDHEPFTANQRHVYRNWIQALAADNQRQQALEVLAAARQDDPGSALWALWAQRLAE